MSNLMKEDESFDQMVYLRIFEGCNLHCLHCFIPSNPKKLDIESLPEYLSILKEKIPSNERILFQWHGGEPTALGADHIRAIHKIITEEMSEYEVRHSIQTNNYIVDDKLLALYHDVFDSEIGISWDYKIRQTKKNDASSNNTYEEVFWDNTKKLIENGISPFLVITTTKLLFEQYKNTNELIDFLVSKGITKVHFEKLTKTGYARENWSLIGITNRDYSRYMSRLQKSYQLYKKSRVYADNQLHISPLDGYMDSIERLEKGQSGGYGCLSGKCDSKFHTIDENGYKYGCTAINSESDNKNTSVVNFINFIDEEKLKSERKIRQLSCDGCEYITVCNSGCLASEKFDYSNECSGGKLIFETTQILHRNK